jgi:hypothetical protein
MNSPNLAIAGVYKPASPLVDRYLSAWMTRRPWPVDFTPRELLTGQLRRIRQLHGSNEARSFAAYLRWMNLFPIRIGGAA